jgi:hypothetical protein
MSWRLCLYSRPFVLTNNMPLHFYPTLALTLSPDLASNESRRVTYWEEARAYKWYQRITSQPAYRHYLYFATTLSLLYNYRLLLWSTNAPIISVHHRGSGLAKTPRRHDNSLQPSQHRLRHRELSSLDLVWARAKQESGGVARA